MAAEENIARSPRLNSFLGVVTDSSGAIAQGVKVTATNVDVNMVMEGATSVTGEYRMLPLPVRRYAVRAMFSGFFQFLFSFLGCSSLCIRNCLPCPTKS